MFALTHPTPRRAHGASAVVGDPTPYGEPIPGYLPSNEQLDLDDPVHRALVLGIYVTAAITALAATLMALVDGGNALQLVAFSALLIAAVALALNVLRHRRRT